MHALAEYGIAAHWRYKEGGKADRDRDYESKLAWVRQLLEWQHDVTDAQEFVESRKVDVFQDEVNSCASVTSCCHSRSCSTTSPMRRSSSSRSRSTCSRTRCSSSRR